MNSSEELANPQEQTQRSIKLHRSLYKLQNSLMNLFCSYLTHHGRLEAQTTRYLQSESFFSLNWENPRQLELETGSVILKRMRELLQQESLDRRETSPKELLVDTFSFLWTYFLFNGKEDAQGTMSRSYDQEHEELTLSNGSMQNDCEVVAKILQVQTTSMKVSRKIPSS